MVSIGAGDLEYPKGTGHLALLQNIASDFSILSTYELNALCVYAGKLYRCTTAITTSEAWTTAHWTEATVEDVLTAIRSAIDGKANRVANPTAGNLAALDDNGNPVDSHKSLDDISQEIQDALQYAVVVDDKLVPVDGPGSEEVFYNGGDAATYLAEHLPSWTCNGTDQGAVLRNRYGWAPEYYHYDLSLFTDRIVFWVEGQEGGAYGAFTRSIVFPKSGVYSIDIEYAAGYNNYPDALGQARFVVDAGTSGPQDVIGVNDPSIVQTAHLQFVANAGNGSIVIKGKTGLSWPSCCVVISSVKVTLVKEIGIEIGDIVTPDASAQTGQAADAKATHNLLSDKADLAISIDKWTMAANSAPDITLYEFTQKQIVDA